jgi:hypothetical protein
VSSTKYIKRYFNQNWFYHLCALFENPTVSFQKGITKRFNITLIWKVVNFQITQSDMQQTSVSFSCNNDNDARLLIFAANDDISKVI